MIDVQTPWRESGAQLQARHVGRTDELAALRNAVGAWRTGARPHPLYLWGPRGVGKSHLVALFLAELREDLPVGARVLHVPEDVPPAATADDLLRRIDAADRSRFGGPIRKSPPGSLHAVVVVEAFDLHLKGMGPQEQQRLRHAWQEGSWLLVATGCTVPDDLRSSSAPFYQAFSVWPLGGLAEVEAGELLDHLAGQAVVDDPAWPARRAALSRLSGGSPRALTTLGLACASHPDRWASEHLLTAVQQLSAHYQHRFRDLSPQQQRIVDAIILAPVEMSAPEIGAAAGVDGASTAKVCSRLQEDGVLVGRDETTPTVWRVAEPMFRYWYEYRGAGWEESRIAVLGRLLESVLQPDEVIDRLLTQGDEVLQQAAQRAAAGAPEALRVRIHRSLDGDCEQLPRLLEAMEDEDRVQTLLQACRWSHRADALRGCPAALSQLPDWAADLVSGFPATGKAKPRFFELVRRVQQAPAPFRHEAAYLLLQSLRMQLDRRGAPWQLGPVHRRTLAATPYLRAWFLTRGKRTGDGALLLPADLLHSHRPPFQEDWPAVASAALRTGSEALRSAIAAEVPPGTPPIAHPRPGRLRPGDEDVLLAVMRAGGSLETPDLLTWAPALPVLPEEAAQALLAAASRLPERRRLAVQGEGLQGLLALGRRDAVAYGRLKEALVSAPPWAQDLVAHADAMLELQARPRPTHVEVQAVLDALAAAVGRG